MRTFCIMSIISLLRSSLCSTTTFRCFRDECPSVSLVSSTAGNSTSRHCRIVLQETKNISASCSAKGKRKQNKTKPNQQTSQPLIFHTELSASWYVKFLYNRSVGGTDVLLLSKLGAEEQTYFLMLRNLSEKK